MPKIVDPDARRAEIAEAVFRLVAKDGVGAASLRRVADEAGLNVGSVRHYYDSHEALLIHAAQTIYDRVGARVYAHAERVWAGGERRAAVEDMLAELLPLDPRRHDETTVTFAFLTASRWNPALRDLADKMHSGPRQLVRRILSAAGADDGEDRVEALCSLLDGLAYAGVFAPNPPTPDVMRRVISRQLDSVLA